MPMVPESWFAMNPSPRNLPMAAVGIATMTNPVMDEGMYVEPVLAYRCWLVEPGQVDPDLKSWTKKIYWPPMQELEAKCYGGAPFVGPHRQPHVHGCGIYGVKEIPMAEEWLKQSEQGILGVVKMWGRVIVCKDGYLARFAYPAALIAARDKKVERLLPRLAEKYGITTEWAN